MTGSPTPPPVVLRVTYAREAQAVYLAHLDTIDLLGKAIRRAGLPYKISQGYHPRPKVTFGPPLPLGHASRCEFLLLPLERAVDPAAAAAALAAQLPAGFTVLGADLHQGPVPTGNRLRYRLVFRPGAAAVREQARAFLADPQREIVTRRGQAVERLPLGPAVTRLVTDDGENAASPSPTLLVDFEQGTKGVPSAGKVLTALVEFLGPAREDLQLIERNALFP